MLVYWYEPGTLTLDVVGVYNTDTGVSSVSTMSGNGISPLPPFWPEFSLANGRVSFYRPVAEGFLEWHSFTGFGLPPGLLYDTNKNHYFEPDPGSDEYNQITNRGDIPWMSPYSGVLYVNGYYCIIGYNPIDTSYYLQYSDDFGTWNYALIIPISGRLLRIYYIACVGGNITISYNTDESNPVGRERRYIDTFTPQGILVNRDFIYSFSNSEVEFRGNYSKVGGGVGYFQWTPASEGYGFTRLEIDGTMHLEVDGGAGISQVANNRDGGIAFLFGGQDLYNYSSSGALIDNPVAGPNSLSRGILPSEIDSSYITNLFAEYPALKSSGLSPSGNYAFGIINSAPPFVPSWTNYVGCTES